MIGCAAKSIKGSAEPFKLEGGIGSDAERLYNFIKTDAKRKSSPKWLNGVFGPKGAAFFNRLLNEKLVGTVYTIELCQNILMDSEVVVIYDGETLRTEADIQLLTGRILSEPTGLSTACNGMVLTPRHLHVRAIQSIADFEEFWSLDQQAYTNDPEKQAAYAETMKPVLRSWWNAYPNGLIGIFQNRKVCGGMGIRPLDEDWAQKLVQGLDESKLPATMMERYRDREARSAAWYIGGILVDESVPKPTLGLALTQCFYHWLLTCQPSIADTFKLIAFGATDEGIALLNKRGFRKTLDRDENPIFELGPIKSVAQFVSYLSGEVCTL